MSPNEMHSKGGQAAGRHPKIAYVCLYLDCDLLFFYYPFNEWWIVKVHRGGHAQMRCRIPWMGTVQTVGGSVSIASMVFCLFVTSQTTQPRLSNFVACFDHWYFYVFLILYSLKNRQDAAYPLVNEHSYWTSPFLMGQSTINGNFQ